MKSIVIIVAAGKGERMGADLPKAYLPLMGRPILEHTIDIFIKNKHIDGVFTVIGADHVPLFDGLNMPRSSGKWLGHCIGGQTRQDSVRFGLEAIEKYRPEWVWIHDAARPNISPLLIERIASELGGNPAVLPVVAVKDTVRQLEGSKTTLLNREALKLAQTPQAFHYAPILAAHRLFAQLAVTDDAALAQEAGLPVKLVEGDSRNIKLTTPDDVSLMTALLTPAYETRTGFGLDVHALKMHDPAKPAAQQHITLCGVKIPFDYYLVGHSDADAGFHALVDAMLGAMGAGDIGQHFPPEDPQWAGADSSRFVIHAYQMLKSRGGDIVNLDITLVCEKPKISPYRDAMISHIADLLKLDRDRVSVKATTTEKLGFLGRGEGIAAHAVATLTLPVKS